MPADGMRRLQRHSQFHRYYRTDGATGEFPADGRPVGLCRHHPVEDRPYDRTHRCQRAGGVHRHGAQHIQYLRRCRHYGALPRLYRTVARRQGAVHPVRYAQRAGCCPKHPAVAAAHHLPQGHAHHRQGLHLGQQGEHRQQGLRCGQVHRDIQQQRRGRRRRRTICRTDRKREHHCLSGIPL